MKSRPAARAACSISRSVRLPSEWSGVDVQVAAVPPRSRARHAPRAPACGSNAGPGRPNRSVTVTRYGVPGGTIVYGPSRMFHTPGVIGPAR